MVHCAIPRDWRFRRKSSVNQQNCTNGRDRCLGFHPAGRPCSRLTLGTSDPLLPMDRAKLNSSVDRPLLTDPCQSRRGSEDDEEE